jgi:RNA polymerase sigma-70 factor (ECF subfamily)
MGANAPKSADPRLALGLRGLALMSAEAGEGPRPVTGAGERPLPRLSAAPPSTADLLDLMRTDPARGAPLFYDRFQREVNRLVWRLLGADRDHDDLVQQVFLVTLRRISQVREADKLLPWVRAITVNIVYDEIRKRRVRRIFLRDSAQEEVHRSLVHDMEVRDFLLRAKRVMDRMPAAERVVFLLHVLEGKTLPEISEICDHSLATAKRRLRRATKRFEKLLSREPELAALLGRWRLQGDEDDDPSGTHEQGGDA